MSELNDRLRAIGNEEIKVHVSKAESVVSDYMTRVDALCNEAADEIDRLRAELDAMRAGIALCLYFGRLASPAVYIRVGDDLMIEEVCSFTGDEIQPGEHRYYSAPVPADGMKVCRIDGIGDVTLVQDDPAKMPTIVSMVACDNCKGIHKRGEVCPLLAAAPAPVAQKCDGNHVGPRCADPECWNDSPVAQKVPDGFVLVPKEPTPEMIAVLNPHLTHTTYSRYSALLAAAQAQEEK